VTTHADGGQVVEVADLRKSFEVGSALTRGRTTVTAVDGVSFSVGRGESLAIVGESGSGKTTIARILVGLESPTSGSVEIMGRERRFGRTSASERRARSQEAQMVFQDPYSSLDPRQTVEDSIAEVTRVHFKSLSKAEVRGRVGEVLDRVALPSSLAGSYPRAMSGGQRQRVAIAKALAVRPAVMILDESVASLDVSIQAQILNLLADIRDETGISYILISHDLAVVRQVTERVIVLRHGKVVERGSTDGVLDSPAHPYTQRLLAAVPRPGWRLDDVIEVAEVE
jgi:ABC-type oligopeptide transport system ATPase subunit